MRTKSMPLVLKKSDKALTEKVSDETDSSVSLDKSERYLVPEVCIEGGGRIFY